MAGDAARVADMRGGADRVFALALLASILLHALGLALLPSLQSLGIGAASAPQPLVAHLAEPPAPPPAPVAQAPRRAPSTSRPALRRPAPEAVPPPLPVQPPAAEAAPPAAPLTPAGPGPVARIEPVPAATPAEPDARPGYIDRVSEAAKRFKIYPRAAIDNNWEGEVLVLMRIGADGRIAGMHVRRSSGYKVLDQQALEMFRNAKPFVPVPGSLRGREFEVELRVIYNMND